MKNIILVLALILSISSVQAQKQNDNIDSADNFRPQITKNDDSADLNIFAPGGTSAVSSSTDGKKIDAQLVRMNNSAVDKALKGNYQEAISAFREVITRAPELAEPRLNLGIWLGTGKQYDEAIKVLSELTAMKPDYANAHAALGEIFYKKGLLKECIGELRLAYKLDSSNLIVLINLAQSLFEIKEYREALALFETAIKLKPDFPQTYNDLGVVLLTLGENRQAAESFQKAINLDTNNAEAYNNLGVSLSALKKKKEAHEAFLKAVELRPEFTNALFNLGVSFIETGDRPAAQKILSKLEKTNSDLAQKFKDKLWQGYVINASERN